MLLSFNHGSSGPPYNPGYMNSLSECGPAISGMFTEVRGLSRGAFRGRKRAHSLNAPAQLVVSVPLAGDWSAWGSDGHWFSRRYRQADLPSGAQGLRNRREVLGGELYAA